jgi:hypothetical protein
LNPCNPVKSVVISRLFSCHAGLDPASSLFLYCPFLCF